MKIDNTPTIALRSNLEEFCRQIHRDLERGDQRNATSRNPLAAAGLTGQTKALFFRVPQHQREAAKYVLIDYGFSRRDIDAFFTHPDERFLFGAWPAHGPATVD